MVLTNIDLKNVSLIYRKIRQKVPNGKGLIMGQLFPFLTMFVIFFYTIRDLENVQ